MATTEELWAWVQPALEELREDTAELSWPEWQDKLLELLVVDAPSDHPVTEDLLRELEEMSAEDRERALEPERLEALAYEVVERHGDDEAEDESEVEEEQEGEAEPDAAQAEPEADEGDWMAFLAVNGPYWDGTEESWAAFREWLLYEAGQQSVLRSTTELLDYLETLPAQTRITTFAEYGVVIQSASAAPAADAEVAADEFGWVPAESAIALTGIWGEQWQQALRADLDARWGEGWQVQPAEHKALWLSDLLEQNAFGAAEQAEPAAAPAEVESTLDDLAARIRAIPGVEDFSDAEIAELVSEALAKKVS